MAALPPHEATKYGAAKPPVPELGQSPGVGSFHRSYDDRLWLFQRAWEPAEPAKALATLMIVHGTVDHSGVYRELGERLSAAGVAVFASDMRGWGLSDGEELYFNDVEVFAKDVITDYHRIHGEGSPYANVRNRFLLGKSLGGSITAWAAASEPSLWTGLIGLSGAYQITEEVRPPPAAVTALREAAQGGNAKKPFKPLFDPSLIVSDAEALRTWHADPLVRRGMLTVGYLFELLRSCDELPARVKGMRLPVLMLWGTGDRVVPGEGHEMMVASSSASATRMLRYPDGFHNLLAEPALKDKVIADIGAWISEVSGQPLSGKL